MNIESSFGAQSYEYKKNYRISHDDKKPDIYIIQEWCALHGGWCDRLSLTTEDIKTLCEFVKLTEKKEIQSSVASIMGENNSNKKEQTIMINEEETVAKLMKEGFSEGQAHQIYYGLKKDLDTSVYAKPEFSPGQMYQIREGLAHGIDITIYAKPEFDTDQMQQIRYGLEEGLDISIYAKPEFDWRQMSQIYHGIKRGLDISIYAKPEFSWEQMKMIYLGLKEDLDVSIYAKPEFNWRKMFEIFLGLDEGLPVTEIIKRKKTKSSLNAIARRMLES